jgi:hypothetical protein
MPRRGASPLWGPAQCRPGGLDPAHDDDGHVIHRGEATGAGGSGIAGLSIGLLVCMVPDDIVSGSTSSTSPDRPGRRPLIPWIVVTGWVVHRDPLSFQARDILIGLPPHFPGGVADRACQVDFDDRAILLGFAGIGGSCRFSYRAALLSCGFRSGPCAGRIAGGTPGPIGAAAQKRRMSPVTNAR